MRVTPMLLIIVSFDRMYYLRPRAAVEHRGPSIHSGHYVCHVDEAHGWLTLNDEDITEHSTLNRAYIICFEMVIFILYDT